MNHPLRLSLLTASLILAGAGCVRSDSAPRKAPAPEPAIERPSAEAPPESGQAAPTPGPGEMRAADFPLRVKAERFINENQGKKPGESGYETIVDLVVADPDKAGTYYFATSAYDAAKGENFVGVYSMEETTYNWWRAYKKTYKKGDDGSAPTQLRVVGKGGASLYLVADRAGAVRGDATPVSEVGTLYEIDLDKPLDGLKEVASQPAFIEGLRI